MNKIYIPFKIENKMSEEVDRDMQKRNLAALAKSPDGFKFSSTFFPYTSGEIGPYYVQSAGMLADGQAYHQACEDMATLVRRVTELTDREDMVIKAIGSESENIVISGGESRDWIFSFPVAQMLGLSHFMIYKDGKTLGASVKDKRVIHIADLNNEGSSPRDLWMPAIKKAGGNPTDIIFYVDRMEDGIKVMQELKLRSHSVIPLDEQAWSYLQEAKVITPEIYQALCQRMEDKDTWARKMLMSDAGLETLAALLASGKSREKGQKILTVGYPDMKEETVKRLKTKFGPGIERWL